MPPLRPTSILSLAGRPGRTCLPEGARPFVEVPLEGGREAEPLRRGCYWETAFGSAPGDVLVGQPGVEVPGKFLRSARGSALRCQVPHDGGTAHVEKGHACGGVYTWMVQCRRARCSLDALEHPSDHVRGQD